MESTTKMMELQEGPGEQYPTDAEIDMEEAARTGALIDAVLAKVPDRSEPVAYYPFIKIRCHAFACHDEATVTVYWEGPNRSRFLARYCDAHGDVIRPVARPMPRRDATDVEDDR